MSMCVWICRGRSLMNIRRTEVERVVNSLANKKAPGTDKIPSHVIKESASVTIPSITSIINSSFNCGVFPSVWKTAEVCPIPKEGDREVASNNRPISLLPIISTVCEKIAFDQLTSKWKQEVAFNRNFINIFYRRNLTSD